MDQVPLAARKVVKESEAHHNGDLGAMIETFSMTATFSGVSEKRGRLDLASPEESGGRGYVRALHGKSKARHIFCAI